MFFYYYYIIVIKFSYRLLVQITILHILLYNTEILKCKKRQKWQLEIDNVRIKVEKKLKIRL